MIVGLGNPGTKYRDHRHNVGFMAIGHFAARHGAGAFRQGFQGEHTRVRVGGHELLLLVPHTFMNLSGRAVQEAMQFFKLGASDLVAVHDEIDLPFGRIQIKLGGGTAGHRGIKSILESCGDPGFCRLRIGVGRPAGRIPVEHWVLSDFSPEERTSLPDVLERATSALTDLVERGTEAAMNTHNRNLETDPPRE
jgi:PTH1 family peptidyl-tRNA hydrolase